MCFYIDDKTYVTSLYAPVGKLEMNLDRSQGGERIYLCVFNFGEWHPLAYTYAASDGSVLFPEVVVESIYRLGSYKGETIIPLPSLATRLTE